MFFTRLKGEQEDFAKRMGPFSLGGNAPAAACSLTRPVGLVPLGPVEYRVTLVESAEGWAVWSDALPGCSSLGISRAGALANRRLCKLRILNYLHPDQARRSTIFCGL